MRYKNFALPKFDGDYIRQSRFSLIEQTKARLMQHHELSIEWHQTNETPPQSIYEFEKIIFGEKFSSCPATYQDFLKFFNHTYLQATLTIDDKIVGLLIADELVSNKLYYLRLIGIKHEFRNRCLGTKIFSKFINFIQNNSYVAFVSNNEVLQHIAYCSESLINIESIPKGIQQVLASYNKKLFDVKPMQIIKRYYQLQPSGYSDASFLFFCKGKQQWTKTKKPTETVTH